MDVMRADMADKEADSDYERLLLRYEPWRSASRGLPPTPSSWRLWRVFPSGHRHGQTKLTFQAVVWAERKLRAGRWAAHRASVAEGLSPKCSR